jgi:glycerophosphoryl diester phosphodiesterase
MERLIDTGVDGIFTDRIDTLKDVLIRRGLWTEP